MKNLKDIILEKLKVTSSYQRLEELEDFDFDKFFNAIKDNGLTIVSKYLKDDEPIIDNTDFNREYILDCITIGRFDHNDCIVFVFILKNDPRYTRTWRKSSKEQLEMMAKRLKGGDFLQLIQNIYNDIVK